MDIRERIDILKECGLTDDRGYEDLVRIVEVFKEVGCIVTEDNGGVMITHIAAAFARTYTDERVNPLDQVVIEQLEEEPIFTRAKEVVARIKEKISYQLSECEYDFILVHASNVLMQG